MKSFRNFLKENATLKTRFDQFKSTKRHFDKERVKSVLRHGAIHGSDRKTIETNLAKARIQQPYYQVAKLKSKSGNPRNNRVIRLAKKASKKADAAILHDVEQLKRDTAVSKNRKIQKEETTLKTREDQYNSANNKFKKTLVKHTLRRAALSGTDRRKTDNELYKINKGIVNHSTYKGSKNQENDSEKRIQKLQNVANKKSVAYKNQSISDAQKERAINRRRKQVSESHLDFKSTKKPPTRTRDESAYRNKKHFEKLRTKLILKHARRAGMSRDDTEDALWNAQNRITTNKVAKATPEDSNERKLQKVAQRVEKKSRSSLHSSIAQFHRDNKIKDRANFIKKYGKTPHQ